jgi:hypothetical protein
MDMLWHKVSITCSKCGDEPTITCLSASGDGEIMLDLICVKCGIQLRWVSNVTKMMANAIYADLAEHMAKTNPKICPRRPVTPPLLTPPTFTEEDKKWERDIGINPDEENP